MRWMLMVIAIALGCAPTIPFHATETAEVLKAKQVAISIAGGGGVGGPVAQQSASATGLGGGSLRVRVGVGHDQEVGVESTALTDGSSLSASVKLRYKIGFGAHLALVGGAGVAGNFDPTNGSRTPPFVGADVALLASTGTRNSHVQLYGGLRLTVSLPASSDFYQLGPMQLFTLPIGVAFKMSPRAQLFGELGLLGAVSEVRTSGDGLRNYGFMGGYAAIAVQFLAGPL